MTEWLVLLTSDGEVPGSNPTGGEIPLIITLLSSRYDLNNVERDVKHQTINIIL